MRLLIGALLGLICESAPAACVEPCVKAWVDFAPAVDKYVNGSSDIIGNTVNFGGHQWIVIGAEDADVKPKDNGIPIENALVLLQKNGDSGGLFVDKNGENSIAFREKRDDQDLDLGFSEYFDAAYDPSDGYYADNPEEPNWDLPNEYRGSTLQQAMEDISKSFKKTNEKEWNVIAERTLTADDDSSQKITGGDVENQKFWALSRRGEWYELSVETISWSSAWWLRSPSAGNLALLGWPLGDDEDRGIADRGYVCDLLALRPALNLNLASVIFTSAAAAGDGKNSPGNGWTTGVALTSALSDTAIKYTFLDPYDETTGSGIKTPELILKEEDLVAFANASYGPITIVAGLIYNADYNAYAKFTTPDDNDDKGSFELRKQTGLDNGTYTLNIYGEEAAGELYSDFAGKPVVFEAEIDSGAITYLTLLTTDVPFGLDGGEVGLKNGYGYTETWTLGESDGTLSVKAAEAATISGQVTGPGGLIKTGDGTLTLSAPDNDYEGGTFVIGGTLAGNIASGDLTLTTAGATYDGSGAARSIDALNGVVGSTVTIDNDLTVQSGLFDGVITGTGSVTKTGDGTLTLTYTNDYSGGTTIEGGLINFDADGNFGSGQITLDGGGLQWESFTWDLSGRLNAIGTGGGTFDTHGNNVAFETALSGAGGITKLGDGILTLKVANTYGTTNSVGTMIKGGLINFDADDRFGSGQITLDGGGLQWATNTDTDISDRLNPGIGVNGGIFDTNGNDVALSTAFTGNGGITKAGAGTLTLANFGSFSGTYAVGAGVLELKPGTETDLIFNNDLGVTTNFGTLRFDLANVAMKENALSFGSDLGGAFAGTVELANARFSLNGSHVGTVLSSTTAKLRLSEGSKVMLSGPAQVTIGDLIFNSGTLTIEDAFKSDTPLLTVGALDLADGGSVRIDFVPGDTPPPVMPDSFDYFGVGTGTNRKYLVAASGTVTPVDTGNGMSLVVVDDESGEDVSEMDVTSLIKSGSKAVGAATFNYTADVQETDAGAGKGIYLDYGMTTIAAYDGEEVVLDRNASSAPTPAITARLTDRFDPNGASPSPGAVAAGDFVFKDSDTGSLRRADVGSTHGESTYTGTTTVDHLILDVTAAKAFGNTSDLTLKNGAQVNFGTYSQAVGKLSGDDDTSLNLGSGTLTVGIAENETTHNGAGAFNGTITGTTGGGLTKQGQGDFTFAGAFDKLLTLTVGEGKFIVSGAGKLGSDHAYDKDISLTGILEFALTGGTTQTLNGALDGAGDLNVKGGTLVLSNTTNTTRHTGNVAVEGGTLSIGTDDNLGSVGTRTLNGGTLSLSNIDATTYTKDWTLGTGTNIIQSVDGTIETTFGGKLEGSAAGFTKTGTSTLILNGKNTYGGKTTIGAGKLSVGATGALGYNTSGPYDYAGEIAIGANALEFAQGEDVAQILSGEIAGTGTLTQSGHATSTLSLADFGSFSGTYAVGSGVLALKPTTDANLTFNNVLTGVTTNFGTLRFELAMKENELFFGDKVGSAFGGTFDLAQGKLELNETYVKAALGNSSATLKLGANGEASVTDTTGGTAINELSFAGGTLSLPKAFANNTTVTPFTVNTLDLTAAGGAIKLDIAGAEGNIDTTVASDLDYFDTDGLYQKYLVKATSVSGGTPSLGLIDENGNEVSADSQFTVKRTIEGTSSNPVGKATFSYTATVKVDADGADTDGIYLGYGLTEIAAYDGEKVVLDRTDSGAGAQIIAKLTDTKLDGTAIDGNGGSFEFKGKGTGADPLQTASVGNTGSSYHGTTTVDRLEITAATDNAFGFTSRLELKNGAQVGFGTHSQAVGALSTTDTNALLTLGTGSMLTVGGTIDERIYDGAGTFNGTITGGTLKKAGSGNLTLTGSLDSLLIVNDGKFVVSGTGQLGSGSTYGKAITLGDAGILEFSQTGSQTLSSTSTITGGGVLAVTGSGTTLTLSGDNSGYTGNVSVSGGGTLSVSANDNLGTGTVFNLLNDGTLFLSNTDDTTYSRNWTLGEDGTNILRTVDGTTQTTFGGELEGSAAGFTKTGTSTLTLTGQNTYSGTTTIDAGKLTVGNGTTGALGYNASGPYNYEGDIAIGANALEFVQGAGVTQKLSGEISGGSTSTLTQNSADGTATLSIDYDSLKDTFTGTLAPVSGVLEITDSAGLTFNKTLGTGSGTLAFALGDANDVLTFGNDVEGAFTGTIDLVQGKIDLNGANIQTVLGTSGAALRLSADGEAQVSTGTEIKALTFNGGTLSLPAASDPANADGSILIVDTLTVDTRGTIKVDFSALGSVDDSALKTINDFDFTDNDENPKNPLVLAHETDPENIGQRLELVDTSGSSDTSTSFEIGETGQEIGKKTFDYVAQIDDATQDADGGVFLKYGLTEIESYDGKSVSIDGSKSKSNVPTLSAKLTGDGGFDFASDDAEKSFKVGYTESDYTGATTVDKMSITALDDNAFGETSSLALSEDAKVDFGSHSQTVGALSGEAGTSVNLGNGGELTIQATAGSAGAETSFAGSLAGDGQSQLVVGGGTNDTLLVLAGNNSAYEGKITVEEKGTLSVGNDSNLGGAGSTHALSGGTLQLAEDTAAYTHDWTLADETNSTIEVVEGTATLEGVLEGEGGFTKEGDGTLILSAGTGSTGNDYQGDTIVNAGVLQGDIAVGTNLKLLNVAAAPVIAPAPMSQSLSAESIVPLGIGSGNPPTYDGAGENRSIGALDGDADTLVRNVGKPVVMGQGIVNEGLTVTGGGTFDGVIDDTNTALIINGTGETLTLTGENHAGFTVVRAGTLVFGLGATTTTQALVLHGGDVTVEDAVGLSFPRVDVYGSAVYNAPAYGSTATYVGDLDVRNGIMNFYVPAGTPVSAMTFPLLSVVANSAAGKAGDANIDDAQVNVGIHGSATPLNVGDRILLLNAEGSLSASIKNPTTDGIPAAEGIMGATLEFRCNLGSDANNLWCDVSDTHTRQGSKALSEGFLAGLIGINRSVDLVAGPGIDALRETVRGDRDPTVFTTIDNDDSRYHSGSHIDADNRNVLVGTATGTAFGAGHLAIGALFTYGDGNYGTFNSFADAASVKGRGETSHFGVGALAKLTLPGTKDVHPSVEASFQAGRAKTSFKSNDLTDTAGLGVKYKASSNFVGAHVGASVVWEVPDRASLELFGKYLFTHRDGDKLVLNTGDLVEFDAVESRRLRFGGRYTWMLDNLQPYVGLFQEHEFDSRTRATSAGQPIDPPSLQGNTRTVEVGVSLSPSSHRNLSLDFNVQHHSGKREGTSGSLQVKYRF